MKGLVRTAAVAAGFLLSGCFVSETALFDASNASATPLAAGLYEACSSSSDEPVECNPMTVEIGDGGQYAFLVEDDRIAARFRQIGEGDFAVQMAEQDDEEVMYYWASLDGDAMSITLLWCSDLPRTLVDKLIKDGSVEADEDYTTCTAKTPGAVIAAAKSYAAGEAKSDSFVVMKPAAAAQ